MVFYKVWSFRSWGLVSERRSFFLLIVSDCWCRKLPFQEKHVLQQGSILGNLEEIGVLKRYNKNVECCEIDLEGKDNNNVSAVVEFGAGRGYLTQMLADCYGVRKVYLVERKSYKLKVGYACSFLCLPFLFSNLAYFSIHICLTTSRLIGH